MIRLLAKTAGQSFYVSAYPSRKFLPTYTDYLIAFTSQATSETFVIISSTHSTENERYTTFFIDTSTDDAVNSKIKISESGFYTYIIYGQNSATNLDLTSDKIVGEVARGLMQIKAADAWDIPSISIPNNVVYYE